MLEATSGEAVVPGGAVAGDAVGSREKAYSHFRFEALPYEARLMKRVMGRTSGFCSVAAWRNGSRS